MRYIEKPGIAARLTAIVAAAALAAGCDSGADTGTEPGPVTGTVEVTVASSGADVDPDGFMITVDGEAREHVGLNGSVEVNSLEPGEHEVGLSDLAANCSVGGPNPRTVTVEAGGTAAVAFAVTCAARTGDLQVTTTTTGGDIDPDGYEVVVDGGNPLAIDANGTLTITGLPAGDVEIRLNGVAANCSVTLPNPRTVAIPDGGVAQTGFEVACSTIVGDLEVTATTSGTDIDPDGYEVVVDGGTPHAVDANGTVTLTGLPAGQRQVELTGVAANCEVGAPNPRTVTVPDGTVAQTTFDVTCSPVSGNLEVTTTTAGTDIDPDGYQVTVDGGSPQPIGVNATVTLSDLAAGDHEIALTGVAPNCAVTDPNPRTVSVPAGGTVQTTFEVTCSDATGNVEVTTATSGTDLDPDGYELTVDGGSPQPIGIDATVTLSGLSAGDHQLELTGVAPNCSVSGSNPRTVTVPNSGTVQTTFQVDCTDAVGSVEVTTSTTGSDQDPDGYQVTIDGGSGQPIGPNETLVLADVAVGEREVQLTGVASNCGVVGGSNPRTVTVPNGGTVQVAFDVACAAPLSGKIVFHSDRDGDFDIYVANPDGSGVAPLTANSALDQGPAVSPDGTRIVFWSNRSGALDIWVMNANGSTATQLTFGGGAEVQPAWSPDGSKIAYARVVNNGATCQALEGVCYDVFVMNADGSGQTNITNNPEHSDNHPAWSHDGTRIAFSSDRTGDQEVWVMNADGGSPVNISQRPAARDGRPDWSPDDSRIAFDAKIFDGGMAEIWTMDPDGANKVRLTTDDQGFIDFQPRWSPDGSQIAFASDRTGNGEIFRIESDGSVPTQLTFAAGNDSAVDWSP